MPWYKVAFSHGPGHQSHTECFVFEDEKLRKN